MTERRRPPAITVVLPTWDTFESLRTTVEHLAAQSIAADIELVVCAPFADRVHVEPETVARFHSVRVLETGELHGTGPMRAQAVRAALAPVVAFAEDHAFPDPGWAEALLAAHDAPYAAVGPAVYNANPETATSWADFFLGYARWIGPGRRREVGLLPGHNSSYKRALLLRYGPELDRLMEAETVLLWDLRRRGHTLLFEPGARIAHVNFSRLGVFLQVQWHLGRVFAGTRALAWHPVRRAAYAAAAPAIPVIRLSHVVGSALRNRLPLRRLLLTSPVLLAGLAVDCVAQAAGALFGAGSAVDRLAGYEFHRIELNRTGRTPPPVDGRGQAGPPPVRDAAS